MEGDSFSLLSPPFPAATRVPTAPAPTAAYPMKPNDYVSFSGGSAIALIVAATVGGLVLMGAVCFYLLLALKVILTLPLVHQKTFTPAHLSSI